MKKTEEKVFTFINNNNLLNSEEKILVALSGGADSVFLLFFLNKFKRRFKISISAAHVNHGLRGKDSDEDEKFCKNYCAKLKVNFHSTKIDINSLAKKKKLSIEEAGRIERYKFLNETAVLHGYYKIATAHHLDDNAETVLFNLLRGTGIRGYAGIPAMRENIIRPMLPISKEEVVSYLKYHGVDFRIDKSNDSLDYKRNYLRHKVIPLIKKNINESWSESVFSSSQVVNSYLKFIDNNVVANYEKDIILFSGRKLRIDVAKIKTGNIPVVILQEVLKIGIYKNFGLETSFKDLVRLSKFCLESISGKQIQLSKSIIAQKNSAEVLIGKIEIQDKEKIFKIKAGEKVRLKQGKLCIERIDKLPDVKSKDKSSEYIDAKTISGSFEVRNWKSGDYFYPLGMKQKKKISDFLADEKVDSSQKKDVLLLLNNGEVVWVIGHRISNQHKITGLTKKYLRLKMEL